MAEIILTIVVEVVKCLAPPAYREISYLRESKYTTNLQNLKAEVDNLKSERESLLRQVDEAERNGEEIEENVRSWLEGANKVIEEADKFTEDEAAASKRCFGGLCPNLKTRRRLSKEAERQKEAVVKVREDRRFDRISYRTAPEDIRLIPNKDYEPFESRMSTLRSILSALEDRDVNMLGIYGMGGIGKTTLAEEVARKVKSDKLFDQVVFVEVSQNQDIRKIQGVIADKLGLKLHEESDEGRAGRLCEGIQAEKKILIVLDNIWENLDLRVVGIPHGDGCKVLLTARSLNVLSEKMDCRTNFPVGVLNEEEAWSLFKKMAGDYVEGSELEEVGELTWLKLLDLRDCWGLQVIPPNILSKLSHLEELYIGPKSFHNWEVEVEGVKNASLEELKHLPNLTSLELDTHDVSSLPRGLFLEKLERYRISIGGRFWGSTGIWGREFRVELYDQIRLKDSLVVQLQRIEDLELCGLQEQDVDYFRNELVKVGSSHLKRLEMTGSSLALNPAESKRQQESANDLQLHEIILEDNIQISNTLFTGKVRLPELEKLHLLSINVERIWQNQVAAMSCGIQNLTHLTLYSCMNLRCLFSSSTVSSFVQLQCIEIVGCPVLEELIVMDNQEERKKNVVMFPQLQYLKMSDLEKFTSFCTGDLDILEFPSLEELWISKCPEFMVRTTNISTERVFPNLEELKVDAKYIGTNKYLFFEDLLCKLKYLFVELVDEPTIVSLDDFLQRLHTMKVLQIQGYGGRSPKEKVENGMAVEISVANNCYHLENILIRESSVTNNLVILRVKWCDRLVDLVPPSTSFQNLTNLVVSRCKRLKIVLTSSIAKTLVRLRYMEIQSCEEITEIVLVDDVVAKDEVITFRELKELKLLDLKSLTSFCSGNCAFKFPSLERLVVDDCPDMKIFSEGKLSTPKLHEVAQRWGEARWAWKGDLNTTIQKASFWSDDSGLEEDDDTEKEDGQGSDH
ncbi:hypothetical protein AB3S75_012500 [Citrus x aurantiifolia]